MRNLKRALSLALATVMTLGLMVVGTGAVGYTDVTSEDNQEAIEVLQAVGIMTGVTDDEFNPEGVVTRNQMAVIMSQLLNLDYDYYRGINTFTDVPAWAAPYVAACVAEGVTAGIGGGLYGGENNVTAAQAALMIMKALGYFQYQGDFNPDWQVATVRQASQIGLFSGVDSNAEQALTRGQVAQMVLNGLKANMVTFTGTVGTQLTLPDGTQYTAGYVSEYSYRTGTSSKYNALVGGSTDIDKTTGQYYIQLGEELYDGDLRLRGTIDAFGRPANEWKYGTENIGEYSNDSTLIATYEGVKVQKGALYDLVGATTYERLDPESTWTIDDATAYDLDVWVDGQKLDDATQVRVSDYFARNSSGAAGTADAVGRGANVGVTGNGVLTQVYMDDNNNVTIVIINTYLVKATADYNETRESLSIEVIDDINTTGSAETPAIGTTIDNEDIPVSNFKEDDYILVTYAEGEGIQTAQLAEMVTGEVSEYTETENVYINGEKYTYNKLVGTNQSGVTYTIGEDAVVVLDAYGHILYVDQAVSTNSYIFIENETTINNSKTARYNAYFTDGTYQEIVVKRYNGGTSTSDVTNIPAGWYTFSVDENDRYSLNDVRTPLENTFTSNADGTNDNDSSAVVVTENGEVEFASTQLAGIKGDSSTIFVVLESDNDVTVYTGVANVPDITIPKANGSVGDDDYVAADQFANLYVVNHNANNYADYVFIDLTSAPDADVDDANSVSDFLLILKSTGNKTYVANDEYWQYEVLMDGEKTTKYIAEYIVNDDDGVLMRNVKENSKGYITDADVFDDAARRDVITMTSLNGSITFSGDTLSISGDSNGAYILADNCNAVLMVEGTGVKGNNADLLKDDAASYELYQATARAIAGTVKNYNLTGTVYMALDTDNSHVITDLYVTVYGSDEVEAPSNDTSITGIQVKGINATKVDDTHYTVTLNSINAQPGKGTNFTLVGAATGARITAGTYGGTEWNYWASDSDLSTTAGKTFAFTVTAADNTTTTVYYVTVTAVETAYTLKVTNSNAADARVTVNGTRVTVGNGETTDVLATVSGSGSVDVTIQLSGGATVSLDTCTTANVWEGETGVFEVSDFTNDTTLEIKA